MRYITLCMWQWIAAAVILSLVRNGMVGTLEVYLFEATVLAVWNLPITLFLFRYLSGSTARLAQSGAGG